MDLNPSNVLLSAERIEDLDAIRQVWKLSNLGMSRIQVRRHGRGTVKENEFASLFIRRKKVEDTPPFGAVNRRGENTYLPPESRC